MKTIRKNQIAIIIFASVFFFSLSLAAGVDRTIIFEPTAEHPEANGTAVIDKDHISIQAQGLKPDAVYTAWFVNMKPRKSETGAGSPPFLFRTDRWGNGSYSAPLNETPFGKWQMIMVEQHPTGDPTDMKNMVGALKAPCDGFLNKAPALRTNPGERVPFNYGIDSLDGTPGATRASH